MRVYSLLLLKEYRATRVWLENEQKYVRKLNLHNIFPEMIVAYV